MGGLYGTHVPVAQMHVLCEDESIIGRAFYIMEFVQGRVFWEQTLPDMNRDERAAIYDEMNRVIAALHTVPFAQRGLADFGKSGNYFERQIGRWSKQYVASVTHPIPEMDQLMAWLPAHMPASALDASKVSIVHGDYRLDNLMFHPSQPQVMAVLDWELSTIGHPLADIAYNGFIWRSHSPGWGSLDGVDFATSGIPTEEDYVAAYCRRTGRAGIDDWAFYMAFGIFRLASISQGVYRRVLAGNAATEGREAVNGAPALAAQALDILRG